MNLQKSIGCFTLVTSALFWGGQAFATHNAWWLLDPGINCKPDGSNSASKLAYFGDLENTDYSDVNGAEVTCAVNLGGQFRGKFGGSIIEIHPTVPSLRAELFVTSRNPTVPLFCTANARTGTGSSFFSRQVVAATGSDAVQTLQVVPNATAAWGGTMGHATQFIPIRSLVYMCTIPKGDFNLGVSSILGYRTAVCANNTQCQD